jgi:hypothetical protein
MKKYELNFEDKNDKLVICENNEINDCVQKENINMVVCEDNFVGTLKINNKKIINGNLWFARQEREKHIDLIHKTDGVNCKTIVLILESPHVEEYKSKFNYKPAPALGSTGLSLKQHFIKILDDFMTTDMTIEDGEYHIILANAIQYQCSLGQKPGIFRDEVWLKLWVTQKYKQLFMDRIKDYDPDIIINCCTDGNHTLSNNFPIGGKSKINQKYLEYILNDQEHEKVLEILDNKSFSTLKKMTQKAINNTTLKKNVIKIRGYHPCAWNRCEAFRKFQLVESEVE